MSDFLISRYRVSYQVLQPIKLPQYAGSNLRGAFGHALKNIACLSAAQHRGQCMCQPADSCVYRQLFEPPMRFLETQREQHIPTPLIIEPVIGGCVLQVHEQHYFDLVLVGAFAHSQLPIIQLAWQRALHDGIGTKDEQNKRGSARLLGIQLFDQPQLTIPPNPKTVHIQITAPMRLQQQGEWVTAANLTPKVLIWSMIRRYHLMHEVYGQSQSLDFETLQPAINVLGLDRRLRWTEWTRWSNRQKQEMQLSGLTGRVLLSNVSDTLWPYIYLGQWLHAGKNSMFGLGQYHILTELWLSACPSLSHDKIA